MKQTAVRWLIDQLVNGNEVVLKGENYKLFEQALAMEKEQIEQAVNQHYVIPSNYYHKTYGKDQ